MYVKLFDITASNHDDSRLQIAKAIGADGVACAFSDIDIYIFFNSYHSLRQVILDILSYLYIFSH